MKYGGLEDDEELFQCAFLLVIGLSAFMGAIISLIFLMIGFPYSQTAFVILIVIGVFSLYQFRIVKRRIMERIREFEAHERKENLEIRNK